ncbi:uncharacterized protein F4822DRAFT_105390 [Hypoxylon trugodes]|uniref:uncharacterized protein n=1 Tax=Hypoxylon trugodes TaxID=326681 RepID=UPI00218FF6F0|nr:uncharacterized protein F4822DRAFT_105390 [Hypoxylon trugodes]KAI1391782.1 hypothetical protein F4822DRAFT_105390 [Hypoxylon trugodes]
MVKSNEVVKANEHFASQRVEGVVCVFAGATNGIGARTLERSVSLFQSATFYILGRSSARFERDQRPVLDSLKTPGCRIVFIETEVSLIAAVDAASSQIAAAESKVDYLFMSMGTGVPFGGAEYTSEGLEVCFALSYYSRARLLSNLLPLLRQAPNPRVLCVLNGGREKLIDETDLGLEKPGAWSVRGAIKHNTVLMSIALDRFAADEGNSHITFLHNFPGLVRTDNPRKKNPTGLLGLLLRFVNKFIVTFAQFLVGMSSKEAGERQAYHLTSNTYGPGSWRISLKGDVVPDNAALKHYREAGWMDKFWEFTVRTWDRALAQSSGGVSK